MKLKYVADRPYLDVQGGVKKQAIEINLRHLASVGVRGQPDHRCEWRSYWPVGVGQKN